MNWIKNFVRPKIERVFGVKKDVPDNLWVNCKKCQAILFQEDLEANFYICSHCGHHMQLPAQKRVALLSDEGTFEPIEEPHIVPDPLKFKDQKKYTERIRKARAKGEQKDAILAGACKCEGQKIMLAVQDFSFMGGTLGMATGETILRAGEKAIEEKLPFVLVAASGGARMQEGILSLMQMPRTILMVQSLRQARLPYLVILTNPTTGGVSASYGMLGDVHIAEPDALIGFAGPRVISQTINEKLPKGFQRAEYLLDHGMVDMVVHRKKLKTTIACLIALLMKKPNDKNARITA